MKREIISPLLLRGNIFLSWKKKKEEKKKERRGKKKREERNREKKKERREGRRKRDPPSCSGTIQQRTIPERTPPGVVLSLPKSKVRRCLFF